MAAMSPTPIRRCLVCLLPLLLLLGTAAVSYAGLTIKNGYFRDTEQDRYFIPRGFAYQVWNPAVYADQTIEELDRDLTAMQAAGANSLRVEFVWEGIERQEGIFDWSRTDHLVRRAEELGLKLFILIGYQYPPTWLVKNHPQVVAQTATGASSPILNYNNPVARAAYARIISEVCRHYRHSPAIAGWILGNEFAYYELWEGSEQKTFVGYDAAWSLPAFRAYLAETYQQRIELLNAAWDTEYPDFHAVPMAPLYPPDRNDHKAIRRSGYHDLIQWRKRSIADFIAAGAAAAKQAAPEQLISYSMVGGIFNGLDSNFTAEDALVIADRCRAAGAPLDFMSINNYAWALTGHELRSVDFGIAKFRDLLNLPVLVSETGHSSTENNFPGAAPRQAKALVSSVWESLSSGAMGVHIFHWNDRDGYLAGYYSREAGFGVVDQNRRPKPGVYDAVTTMFRQMTSLPVERLLPGSRSPAANILVFWPEEIDLGYNRANEEIAGLWGALRRLGHRPRLIDGNGLDAMLRDGFPPQVKALLLPRNFQMRPDHLAALPRLLASGINIHANADLPGRFDARHAENPGWHEAMAELFGINAAGAAIAFESGAGPRGAWEDGYSDISITMATGASLPLPAPAFSPFATWKIVQGITPANDATVQALFTSAKTGGAPQPALVTKNHARARTALTPFALGDIIPPRRPGFLFCPATLPWDVRTAWLNAIYRDHFAMPPVLTTSGVGADYVLADLRLRDDGILLALMNEHDQPATVSIASPLLPPGKVIDLLDNSILPPRRLRNLRLGADDYRLFLLPLSPVNPADNE